ncbi:hypothetical protein D7030_04870 [Flavobacteriaceae bacterium AU392]|nr:hypothetical protein D1817_11345 [Flavobacteriaceae bacterium]RKM86008.1 hypothetical protein D7030_04870 [Flavobacteriaceae bacterium AU392]
MKVTYTKNKLFFSLLVIVCFIAIKLSAQSKMSASGWQKDLKFLQATIHNDYSFLFKKTTEEEFDKKVEQLYNEIPVLQDHEIIAGLGKIVASFKYGHTTLNYRRLRFHSIPFTLYHYNDGIHIKAAHKDYKEFIGAKIIAVEGMPISDVLKAIHPVIPAENDQFFKKSAMNFLCIPEVLHAQKVMKELKNSISFTLEQNGKTYKQNFKAIEARKAQPNNKWVNANSEGELPLYLKNPDKGYYFEYLEKDSTLYVKFQRTRDDRQEDIATFFKRVFDFVEKNNVDCFVLDVRLNGGGNSYKNIPIITGIIRSQKINQVGNLFVITGRRTYSAAQNLVNELDKYTNAIFVGEPTSENKNFYGDTRRVVLPNSKIPVSLSFAWWQSGPLWEDADWTAPDLAVEMSYEDYHTNKDPILDAVLNFSESDFILNLVNHLTQIFKSSELGKAKDETKKIIQDPRYKYQHSIIEARLNTIGYNFITNKQIEQALSVFSFNTELFPNSANVWDSLAETLALKSRHQDIGKAIQYYKKAIKLDPDGDTGKNAKKMLEQININ